MSQIRKVGTTLSLKSDLRSIEKSKKNFTLKPRRSRPSETALRLRIFPRGGPPLGEKNFQKKSKLMTPINTSYPKVGPQKWDPMCHKLRPHLGSWRPGSAHYDQLLSHFKIARYILVIFLKKNLMDICVHVSKTSKMISKM